jgi:hypothetical protein
MSRSCLELHPHRAEFVFQQVPIIRCLYALVRVESTPLASELMLLPSAR